MPLPGMEMMMPPGGGGMPGAMGMPGGGGENPMVEMGMSALDGLTNRQPNPTVAMQKVEEALKLAHKLVMAALPQINQWSPKLAKDLHTIGRQILVTQLELQKDQPPQLPPELMAGMMGATGTPMGTPFGSAP